MEPDEARLKGVVVISLPPASDPSIGKTITFYTVPDESLYQTHQTPEDPFPVNPPSNPENSLLTRRITHGSTNRKVGGLLGIFLFAFILLSPLTPQSHFKLRSSNDEEDNHDESETFLFPLYPKFGNQDKSTGDVELKLGRFVEKQSGMAGASLRTTQLMSRSTVSVVDSSTIMSVKGNVFPHGLYFTRLLIGSPPKSYFLDIDTGSDLTWVQCDAPCSSCAKGPNPLYMPAKNKLVRSRETMCKEVQKNLKSTYCDTCTQCDYEIEYADHSSSMGVLARDELSLKSSNGSDIKSDIVFGCAYDQQGSLLSSLVKSDGILGLSRSKVSLPTQLANQGIVKNVVGHCLTYDATGGGYMFLGEELVPYWNIVWVPMANSFITNSYMARAARISYGSRRLSTGQLDDSEGPVIFDSGSSYSYFPKKSYSNLITYLEEVTDERLVRDLSDSTLPLCWKLESPVRSFEEIKQFFMPLTIQFGSKWWFVSSKFNIPPEGYLVINRSGNVCLGILDGSDIHDGSTIILGDISLRGKLIIYDNENHRIGWADSNCKNPKRFKSLPFLAGRDFSI